MLIHHLTVGSLLGLSELPFGAILKARETLKKTQSDSEDSEDEDSNEDISEAEGPSTRRFGDREEQKEKKERREIEHRSNKHAYVFICSLTFAVSQYIM